jgi:hypothetical protein
MSHCDVLRLEQSQCHASERSERRDLQANTGRQCHLDLQTFNVKRVFIRTLNTSHCTCLLSLFIKIQPNTLNYVMQAYILLFCITASPTRFDSYRVIVRETNTRAYVCENPQPHQKALYMHLCVQHISSGMNYNLSLLFVLH